MIAEAQVGSCTNDSRILLVLDDSEIALRAVRYVAQFVGRRRQFRICLVHVLPPLPPSLEEHGGSSNADRERQLDLAMREEQDRWIAATKKRAQKSLDQAGKLLTKSGIPVQRSKCCSANQAKQKRRPTHCSEWQVSASATPWWLVGDLSRGSTSCSVRI